ncbi:hypothetical protein [Methylibium sp.]|nr:hypothetical protein [Methylibium sp.]
MARSLEIPINAFSLRGGVVESSWKNAESKVTLRQYDVQEPTK